MTRSRMTFTAIGMLGLALAAAPVVHGQSGTDRSTQQRIERVVAELNEGTSIAGRDDIKSYRILFDAYLEMTDPPQPVGASFHIGTVHPGMDGWTEVSSWAESNPAMADAIIEAKNRRIVGLPYGESNVSAAYRAAGLVADIAVDNNLRRNDFTYLLATETIGAFAAAESYRLLEAGQVEQALELAVAHLFVARQFCDREFYTEKRASILILCDALGNLRDMFYNYRSLISADQFREIAVAEIPFLRPDRNALFMPEGDRIVSEALIRDVFDSRGRADVDKFTNTFAAIQSEEEPLTRFGAARRWAMIAHVHGSLDASLERLTLIYDDWWRRWRIQEYDPLLDFETQFERTNPVKYAAVVYSIENIEGLFEIRKRLIANVNGTAVAAGLCAYHNTFGTTPQDTDRIYAQFIRKSSDIDPYDEDYGTFRYIMPTGRHPVETTFGRMWIESGQGILYSRGQDNEDDRAGEHTDDGAAGDIIIWPPVRALAREQNLRD